MKIEMLNIDELTPYKFNPRDNSEAIEYVANSIKEFGFKVPIVIDSSNVIVAGHTRLEAARSLGIKEVPCIVADDLSEEQVKAFRLADNKVSEIAKWDDDLLSMELEELENLDINMEMFGFEELENLDIDEDDGAKEDDFEILLSDEPVAQSGDVFQLGRHRLMCGDSTKLEDVKQLVSEQSIDLLITDPPYNVAYEGKTEEKLTIENDKKSDADFYNFLLSAFSNACEVMESGKPFYCWYASSEVVNFNRAIIDAGFLVKQELIWNKNSMVIGRQDYQWKHEPCLYGWKEGAAHVWYSDRKQTTVLDFDKPQRNGEHPTMKPIPLFDYQIKNSSQKGDNVLDLFGGSGTTMMACEQNGRNAFLMEYDPKYVDVIINRWEIFTGEKAIKIN